MPASHWNPQIYSGFAWDITKSSLSLLEINKAIRFDLLNGVERLRSDRVLNGAVHPSGLGCEIGTFQSMPNRSSYYRQRWCNLGRPMTRSGIDLFLIFWIALAPVANGFEACLDHRNDQVSLSPTGHRSQSLHPKSHHASENPSPDQKEQRSCHFSGCGFHACGGYALIRSEWKPPSALNRVYSVPFQTSVQTQSWSPELRPPA